MNYIRHLTGFFDRVCKDHRLNPTHISIYMAIFQFWNINRFRNPLSISRSEIMELSKVGSRNTYHKCMKELHQFGYFRYDPSYHPLRGSWVYLYFFKTPEEGDRYKKETGSELALDKTETGDEQAEDGLSAEALACKGFPTPLNISKHIKLNKTISLAEKREVDEKGGEKEEDKMEKEMSPAENQTNIAEKGAISPRKGTPNPPIESNPPENDSVPERKPSGADEVNSFFLSSGYPGAEALKFFHYYSSTGWKLGGKTPIENWQSAAHSWMLHAQNTHGHATKTGNAKREPDTNHLHARTDKNYAEPL